MGGKDDGLTCTAADILTGGAVELICKARELDCMVEAVTGGAERLTGEAKEFT